MPKKFTRAEANEMIRTLAHDLITRELAELYDIIEHGYRPSQAIEGGPRKPLSTHEIKAARVEAQSWQSDLEKIADMTDAEVFSYLDLNFDMTEGDILDSALIEE